jgi:DNA-binding MarR family transcriptional regulator
MVHYVVKQKSRRARGVPYLTVKQAEVLVAIAAHWLCCKCAPVLRKLADFLRMKPQTLSTCITSLVRRGFLLGERRRYRSGWTGIVYSTLQPSAIAWAELAA